MSGQLVEAVWPSTTRRILGTSGMINGDKNTRQRLKRLALRAFSPKYMNAYTSVIKSGITSNVQASIPCFLDVNVLPRFVFFYFDRNLIRMFLVRPATWGRQTGQLLPWNVLSGFEKKSSYSSYRIKTKVVCEFSMSCFFRHFQFFFNVNLLKYKEAAYGRSIFSGNNIF